MYAHHCRPAGALFVRLCLVFALAAPTPCAGATVPSAPGPLRVSADVFTEFVDQSTSGLGKAPHEAQQFLAGFPAAPGTPYDLLSTNVQTPGTLGHTQLRVRGAANIGNVDAGLELGAGYVRGS